MFYCTQPQNLTVSTSTRHASDIEITASNDWQSMTLSSDLLTNIHGNKLKDWSEVGTISLKPKPGADITKVVFANFKWKKD
jgi:hypothetical protein